jgi:hypothetical protein
MRECYEFKIMQFTEANKMSYQRIVTKERLKKKKLKIVVIG